MSDDNDKTVTQKALEAILGAGGTPAGQPTTVRPGRFYGGQHTLPSAAYTSAEVFSPDQAELVKEFLEAIEEAKDKTVFALADGTMSPQDFGIKTELEASKTQVLSKVEQWERENKETQAQQIRLAKINARGPLWVKIAGYVAWALLAILYAVMAVSGG